MRKYCSLNVFVSLGLIVFGAAWLKLTLSMQSAGVGDASIWGTGATMPKFMLIIFMALNIWVFISEVMAAGKRQGREPTEEVKGKSKGVFLVAALMALIFVYTLILEHVGFVLSTSALLLAAMLLFGERNKIMVVAVPVGFTAALFVVFQYALKITLPTLFI